MIKKSKICWTKRKTITLCLREGPWCIILNSAPIVAPADSGVIYAIGELTSQVTLCPQWKCSIQSWEMAEAMSMLRSQVWVAVMNMELFAIRGYNISERLFHCRSIWSSNSKISKVVLLSAENQLFVQPLYRINFMSAAVTTEYLSHEFIDEILLCPLLRSPLIIKSKCLSLMYLRRSKKLQQIKLFPQLHHKRCAFCTD